MFPEVFHISFQTQIQIGADEPSFYSYRDIVQYVSKSRISGAHDTGQEHGRIRESLDAFCMHHPLHQDPTTW